MIPEPGHAALEHLRAVVARIERGGAMARAGGALSLGIAAIDGALGEEGLRRGALHEVSGAAADGFAVWLAGRLAAGGIGAVLWCGLARGHDLYPPGLAALGLDPSRLLMVHCPDRAGLLAAAEEGLRGGGLAALVVEDDRPPDRIAGRRLQLAAEEGGVTGLLLCRDATWRHGARRRGAMTPDAADGNILPPSAAVSRWRVDPAPGGTPGETHGRWRLALLRCRAGGTGNWMVDWHEKTFRLALVPAAGDRPSGA